MNPLVTGLRHPTGGLGAQEVEGGTPEPAAGLREEP